MAAGRIRASATFDPLGSAFFVRVVGGSLVLAGIGILARTLARSSPSKATEARETGGPLEMMLISVAYVAVLPAVGYILATALALFVTIFRLGTRRWATLVAVPLVTTGVLYIVLEKLIGIRLP